MMMARRLSLLLLMCLSLLCDQSVQAGRSDDPPPKLFENVKANAPWHLSEDAKDIIYRSTETSEASLTFRKATFQKNLFELRFQTKAHQIILISGRHRLNIPITLSTRTRRLVLDNRVDSTSITFDRHPLLSPDQKAWAKLIGDTTIPNFTILFQGKKGTTLQFYHDRRKLVLTRPYQPDAAPVAPPVLAPPTSPPIDSSTKTVPVNSLKLSQLREHLFELTATTPSKQKIRFSACLLNKNGFALAALPPILRATTLTAHLPNLPNQTVPVQLWAIDRHFNLALIKIAESDLVKGDLWVSALATSTSLPSINDRFLPLQTERRFKSDPAPVPQLKAIRQSEQLSADLIKRLTLPQSHQATWLVLDSSFSSPFHVGLPLVNVSGRVEGLIIPWSPTSPDQPQGLAVTIASLKGLIDQQNQSALTLKGLRAAESQKP